MKKFKKILCLDIDDCIFPGNSFFFGDERPNDNFDILELNMKRIGMLIEEHDMGVFITSSWYIRFKIIDDNLYLRREDGILIHDEIKVTEIMRKYTDGRIYGLSCGRRQEDICKLLNDDHIVVNMDDMELGKNIIIDYGIKYDLVEPQIVSENYHWAEVDGFFTNKIAYRIRKFLEGINDD